MIPSPARCWNFLRFLSCCTVIFPAPSASRFLERVEPHTQLEKIRRDLELAGEAREYLRESSRPSLAGVCEPSPLLEKLRVEGLALAALEILALVEVARAGLDMYRTFAKPSAPRAAQHEGAGAERQSIPPKRVLEKGAERSSVSALERPNAVRLAVSPVAPSAMPRLSELARALPDFRSLVTELGGKINPDGTVDSSASPELGRVRRAIERAKLEIQSSLEHMLRRFSQDTCFRTPW